jgi:hypothetical protein
MKIKNVFHDDELISLSCEKVQSIFKFLDMEEGHLIKIINQFFP